MIAHVVLYTPKAVLTEAEQSELQESLRDAIAHIGGIEGHFIGRRLDTGFAYNAIGETPYEYVAILEFASRQALADYLSHPLHARLAGAFWRCCGNTLILDVEQFSV